MDGRGEGGRGGAGKLVELLVFNAQPTGTVISRLEEVIQKS